jgi:hypothetical protein
MSSVVETASTTLEALRVKTYFAVGLTGISSGAGAETTSSRARMVTMSSTTGVTTSGRRLRRGATARRAQARMVAAKVLQRLAGDAA